ncbi:MAG: Sensor protein resE [Patescibacteria group bacterium]|nr:Sensor protein resE [Patescibacteria group bacterium]
MIELIGVVVSILATLMVGGLAYLKNKNSATNRLFGLLCVAMAGWTGFNYLSVHLSLGQLNLIRLIMFFVVLMNTSFFFFVQNFPSPKMKINRWAVIGIIYATLVLADALSPFLFSRLLVENGSVSPVPGPGIILFLIHAVIFAGGGVVWLIRRYWLSAGLLRAQLRYVLIGTVLFMTLLPLTNFILPLAAHISSLIILSPFYTAFFAFATGYAVLRHRLFDVRAIVARSLTYALLLLTLAGLFGLIFLSTQKLLIHGVVGSGGQSILSATLAISLALTFQPLRRFFERITNRVFYRDNYDSQVVLSKFSKVLVSELELNRILKKTLTQLCEDLHIQFGQIIVFNNDRVYRIGHYGELPKRLMIAPELAKFNKPMIVADELDGGERKSIMDKHSIRVALNLRTREEFVGYLLLGDKLSGDIYSGQDLELLEIVGKELAVAILNAKAYAEIQDFNLTLQARVDHATNRLRVANRHLKELDHAKDEFISMASHQLRTPLTTIKGYLSMLLEGDAGKLTKPQKEFVDYAFGSSERMVNLISDLLNVSRLSAGRFLIQTKPTDMVQMIADEVRQLGSHAKAKGIQLVFDKPAEPLPPAEIDDNKTRQVIMNFIDNAIYYTQKGEVRVTLEQSGDSVRLEVRDTGIGVPEKAKRKLFSKFFRADNAQIVRPDGTGLGLYLAKRVIEDQGGTIIFSSIEGKGSTFGFELPFKHPKPKHEDTHGRSKT